MMLCDIDHFKEFNDTLGQDCGDFILLSIAKLFRTSIRKQDHLARWGGAEFLFLLPETKEQGGKVLAEKLGQQISLHPFVFQGHELHITLSFGVSIFHDYAITLDTCRKEFEQALEHAQKGRREHCKTL